MKKTRTLLVKLMIFLFVITFVGTPSVYAYSDVSSGHKYYNAISFITDLGIVSGYSDGTYKPSQTINRAELLKILVESVSNEFIDLVPYESENCFTDVAANQWFTKYVCFAKASGFVNGYSDGTFKPAQTVTFVEALKMAMEILSYPYDASDPWYKGLVETASLYNFIPLDVTAFDQAFNRGQMAELITRMLKYTTGELNDYLGDSVVYTVTYESIDSGLNFEEDINPPSGEMSITSVAFSNGEHIEDFYTCDSYDFNPQLTISNIPESTESLVLFVDDFYNVPDIFNHWVVWNILPTGDEVTIMQDSVPGIEGTNAFGQLGYSGPCPPTGETHEYYFSVYALNSMINLSEGATADEVNSVITPYILDSADITGTYY